MFQKSSYSTQFCPDVKAVVSPPNPRGRHKTVVCLEMNKTSLDWHAEDKIDTDCFDKSSKILSSDASAFLLDNGLSAIRLLGSGTFSDVYLCITGNTSLKFAVKIIPKALTIHDDHNTSRLQRAMGNERCILNGLRKRQHPNLLFLHYYFENDHYLGLVLDYGDKGDLDSVIKRQGNPGLGRTCVWRYLGRWLVV